MTRAAALSIAGGVVALALAVLLVWELLAAGALGAQNARYQALVRERASLSTRATTLAGSEASARQRLVVVTAHETRERRRARSQRRSIAALHGQVSSLRRDVAALGG